MRYLPTPAAPWVLFAMMLALAACTGSAAERKCSDHAECAPTERCAAGRCVRGGVVCAETSDCGDAMACCGGVCVASSCCAADSDCPDGYCAGGACLTGDRGPCGAEGTCSSGRCLATTDTCVECIHSDDCASTDLVCTSSHRCAPAGATCSPEACASTGQICAPEEGACRPCISDAECGELHCNDANRCASCTDSTDCGLGRSCEAGRCVPEQGLACLRDADCGDRVCRLVGPERVCVDCVPGDCGDLRTCTAGRCVATNPECTTDAECGPPAEICQGQLCVAGCAGTSCPEGQACSPGSGRCVPTSTGSGVLGATCAGHDDCLSGVCWPVQTDSGAKLMCSRTCVTHDDCPTDFVCYELGDGAFCARKSDAFPTPPIPPLDGLPGESCVGDFVNGACRTGYCHSTTRGGGPVCMEMCGNDATCEALSPGAVCVSGWPVGVDVNGNGGYDLGEITLYTQLCHAPWGALAAHATCGSIPGGPVLANDHDRCQSGWCLQTPDLTATARCAAPCCSPADCASPYTVCKPIDVHDGIRDSTSTPYAFQKACLWREWQGSRSLGEPCASDADCRSELCVAGPSGTKRCTQTCCTNDECAGLDWATGCRPPFTGPHTVADANFQAISTSLGRVATTALGTATASAVGTLCMPK